MDVSLDSTNRLRPEDFGAISSDTFDRLAHPRRVIETELTIERDDGGVLRLRSWRVQHDDLRGPCKGGVRFHPAVSQDEVERLARAMSLKCALYRLPFGGGKGGIAVDPHQLSEAELERLTRAYARSIAPFVGPSQDVPAPDMNTGEREMRWLREELASWRGADHAALVTGKAVDRGGIPGRDEATGSGAFFVIEAALDHSSIDPGERSVAVQGLGSAAQPLLRRLYDAGYTVRAVSDSSTGVFAADGLDIPTLLEAKEVHGELADADLDSLADGVVEKISSESLMTCDVDILVPAALGDVITDDNAADVAAAYIFEVANLAVSPSADATLQSRDVRVFPDILTNGGGVVVSWMEWRNNLARASSSRDDVIAELDDRMRDATSRVLDRAASTGQTIRHSALHDALEALTHSNTQEDP